MALIVKVWVDSDPLVDKPLVDLTESSVAVKAALVDCPAKDESFCVNSVACQLAIASLQLYLLNADAAQDKVAKLAELDAEKARVTALTPVVVDAGIITNLKK